VHKYVAVFLDSGLGLRAGKFHAGVFSSSSLLHASRTSAFIFLFVRSFVCMCCMFAVRQSTLVRGKTRSCFGFILLLSLVVPLDALSFTAASSCRMSKNVRWPVVAMLFFFFQNCMFFWQTSCNFVFGCLLICAFSNESVECLSTVRLVHKLLC